MTPLSLRKERAIDFFKFSEQFLEYLNRKSQETNKNIETDINGIPIVDIEASDSDWF